MTLLGMDALERALLREEWDHRLVVTPMLDRNQVTEASIDLRLGNDFLALRRSLHGGVELDDDVLRGVELTADAPAIAAAGERVQAEIDSLYESVSVPFGSGFWLHPQQFALGSTLEFVRLPPTLGAYVLSRSTWGRLGLLVATAVTVQPGFAGALTLELVNESDSPIKLYPGLKIAQLTVFALADSGSATHYDGADKGAADASTEPPLPREATYRWPTGPQAARVVKEHAELVKIKRVGAKLAEV